MIRKLMGISLLALLYCAAIGCGTTRLAWLSDPEVQKVSNDVFHAELRPAGIRSGDTVSYKAFVLVLKNKTNKELGIIWDKTLFIHNGQMNGGFMFEGITHEDRDKPKPPARVTPGGTFRKKIWPNSLVFFFVPERARFSGGAWIHRELNPGQNGVYLTVKSGQREINDKLILNISVQEIN